MLPGRVSAGGHAKGRPVQVAFSLAAGDCCPLRVFACAAGRSSVRVVTRTAGVKLSMCRGSCSGSIVEDAIMFFKSQIGIS